MTSLTSNLRTLDRRNWLRADEFGAMDRVWDTLFTAAPAFELDVVERAEEVVLYADLPGVKRDQIDITVDGHHLLITAERQGEALGENDVRSFSERKFGKVARRIALTDRLDLSQVQADLNDGVLTVRIAKKAELKPRKIEIK